MHGISIMAMTRITAVALATALGLTFTSRITERTGSALNYRFTGELSGDTMSGTINMGEYRSATWTARRVANA